MVLGFVLMTRCLVEERIVVMKKLWIGFVTLYMLAIGCGSDNPTSSNSAVVGTYAIQRAEVILPDFTIINEPPDLTGSFILSADGQYAMTAVSVDETVDISNTGTYSFANGALAFDNPGISSTLSGNQITLRLTGSIGSIVLVYLKP